MQRLGYLYRWAKKYVGVIIFIITLNFILQWLYSYISIFLQYAFSLLGKEDTDVNLPNFIIKMFNMFGSEVLTVIITIAVSIVLLQAFRSCLRFLDNYLKSRTTESMAYNMRTRLYDHIVDLPFANLNHLDVGDTIQRCTSDIDTASSFVSSQLPELFSIFMTIGIGAYQVGRINLILMLVSLISVPLLGVASIVWFRYVNKAFQKVEAAESKLTTIVQENVNGARVVRAFANEVYEFEKMDAANKEFVQIDMKLCKKESFFWGFCDFVSALQYAITVTVGIYLAYHNKVVASDIIASLLLLGMVVWPIRGLGRIISTFGKTLVAVDRMEHILKTDVEYKENGTIKPKINGKIKFENVCFKFDDTDKDLIKDLSFTINAGETIAIVGKTGSGKSTICNLLTRFLENTSGQIFLDDINIKQIEKHYLRKNVRMVLQDPFLFSRSIYENISITDNKIARGCVIEAAKLAHIDGEIAKFANGYDTYVGEKGTTLSGGQKQRIAIARILVSQAPIVIFDDSLSALDTKTDYLIRKSMKKTKNKQTTIIITHRTTTAKECDRIMVLNNGKIEAFATHNELINQPGLYKDLWGIQGDLESEFNDVLKGGEIDA